MRRAWRPWTLALLALGLVAAACGGDDGDGARASTTAGGSEDAPTTTESASPAAFPADSTMAQLRDKGKILIGVKFDQPLFGFKNPTNNQVELVIATYTINDARKQRVDFAGPYYTAGQDILVRKDNTSIKGVQDLNGK